MDKIRMSCAETPLEIHIKASNMIVLLTLHANSRVQQPVQCMMAKMQNSVMKDAADLDPCCRINGSETRKTPRVRATSGSGGGAWTGEVLH